MKNWKWLVSVFGAAFDLHRGGACRDGGGVTRVDAMLQALPRHDAVQRAGIDVQEPQRARKALRRGAFARSARAVYCYHFHNIETSAPARGE